MYCTDYPAAAAPSSPIFPGRHPSESRAATGALSAPGVGKQGSNAAVALEKQRQKPWAGAALPIVGKVGKALQGFAWLRNRGQEHSRSLKEPPRFCTRFRPRVLCKGKRRACCGYHTPEALGNLLQEKGELPVPAGPHHPVLSACLLCGLCLPYPGDSAFTSHITRVTL